LKKKVFQYQMAHAGQGSAAAVSRPSEVLERDEMILKYTPLIKYIAHRLAMRLPSHISVKDLMSAGVIGLMHAVSKFDPKKNVHFKTYAEFRIRGAMLDELRALDWVPRSVRQKASQIEKTILHLEKERGRPVEDEEVAKEMGVRLDEYYQMLDGSSGISLVDIDTVRQDVGGFSSEDRFGTLLAYKGDDPFHLFSVKELKGILARAIEELPAREKNVLALYYYEELTLKEIGEIMDLTESRICQIHTKCILKLRGKLKRILKDAV
jgi:RNA polymerase sigma factor FliA